MVRAVAPEKKVGVRRPLAARNPENERNFLRKCCGRKNGWREAPKFFEHIERAAPRKIWRYYARNAQIFRFQKSSERKINHSSYHTHPLNAITHTMSSFRCLYSFVLFVSIYYPHEFVFLDDADNHTVGFLNQTSIIGVHHNPQQCFIRFIETKVLSLHFFASFGREFRVDSVTIFPLVSSTLVRRRRFFLYFSHISKQLSECRILANHLCSQVIFCMLEAMISFIFTSTFTTRHELENGLAISTATHFSSDFGTQWFRE